VVPFANRDERFEPQAGRITEVSGHGAVGVTGVDAEQRG
jgi:hypothetical protein